MMNTNAKKPQPDAHDTVESVEAFVQWVRENVQGQSLLYRGLADSTWDVESAASRRVRKAGEPEEMPHSTEAIEDYLKLQLLGKARGLDLDEHNGGRLCDLKLLAKLQHAGAATCMIDFTHDPLVALWFACQKSKRDGKEQDGKVVIMDTTQTGATIPDMRKKFRARIRFRTVGQDQLDDNIERFLYGRNLWIWPPIPRGSRVIAQRSVFVFGQAVIEDRYYNVVHIPTVAKEKILTLLREKFEVTEESLFGDFAGFALANASDKPYEKYSADAYYDIAREYHRQNKIEKVKLYCDKAIALDPQHADAYHLRGECNEDLQNISQAVEDYTQAIAINPRSVRSLLSRGTVYEIELSEPQKAIADYTKAIKIASEKRGAHSRFRFRFRFELPWAYYMRGCVKAGLGKHAKAIKDFTSAIETNSEMALAYLERSKSHRASGNAGLAAEDEKKAFELNPTLQKNAVVYELINGDSVVYIGTTNDADRRESEHRDKGWLFDALEVKTASMTEEDAMTEEKKQIAEYKRLHGQLPQYNTEPDG